MRWTRNLWLTIPALLVIAWTTPSAQEHESLRLDPEAKSRIAEQMHQAGKHNVLAFDRKSGELLKDELIPERALRQSDSLEHYVHKTAELAAENPNDSVWGAKPDDPVRSCQEPKPLPPPPNCVLCKTGKVLCSKAKFGEGLGDPID